jgi:hypothetical protein
MTLTSLLAVAGAAFVAFRQFRQREMHVERLWIVPCLAMCVVVASYQRLDFSLSGWSLMLLGLAAGIGLGWTRAGLSIASVDVPNRRIATRGGTWMLLLVVVVAVLKLLIKRSAGPQTHTWINASLLLGVGSICAQRLHFYRAYVAARDQTAAHAPLTDEVSR